MRVLLDDQPIAPEPGSVAEAIEVARSRAESRGRLIIAIETDGYPIQESYLESPPADDAGIIEMKLTSADKCKFLSVTITDARNAIDEAVKNQHRAADAIEIGDTERASDPLGSALTTWQAVRDVVDHAGQLLGVQPGEIELAGASAANGAACVEGLIETLNEVKRAINDRDTAALADTLREDLTELADDWRALLTALERRADS